MSFAIQKLGCKTNCKTPFFLIMDVPQGNMGNENSHNDDDDEPEGNGALEIHPRSEIKLSIRQNGPKGR